MIEALTLVIGFGVGIAFHYWLSRSHFYKEWGGWKISIWNGVNDTEWIWVRNSNDDITLRLDREGATFDYVAN